MVGYNYGWIFIDPAVSAETRQAIWEIERNSGRNPWEKLTSGPDSTPEGKFVAVVTVLVLSCVAFAIASVSCRVVTGNSDFGDAIAPLVGFAAAATTLYMIFRHPGQSTESLRPRYIAPRDLDQKAMVLAERSARAVSAIQNSNARKLGFLAGAADDLALSRELWEIGSVLKRQTELRMEQAQFAPAAHDPMVAQLVMPQVQALEQSVNDVAERVGRLAEYAERVRKLDQTITARDTALAAMASNDKYVELLELSSSPEMFAEMNQQANDLDSALKAGISAAVAASRSLGRPGRI